MIAARRASVCIRLLGSQRWDAFRILVHLSAWLPLSWIVWGYFNGNLTVNPIQTAQQRLGRIALVLLLSSLACTPLRLLTGWNRPLAVRRALGVYAFLYAAAHFLVLVGIDYGFHLEFLRKDLAGKPYIWLGAGAFAALLPLAVTSFGWWKRRLGKNWKRLHRLVYFAAPLVVIHFAWARKGSLTTLAGDITLPLVAGLLLVLLLAVRVPPVRRWIVGLRQGQSVARGASVTSGSSR
jgi:sulfoxide reductase heme-binding subunit YedZ